MSNSREVKALGVRLRVDWTEGGFDEYWEHRIKIAVFEARRRYLPYELQEPRETVEVYPYWDLDATDPVWVGPLYMAIASALEDAAQSGIEAARALWEAHEHRREIEERVAAKRQRESEVDTSFLDEL
jgi:hypothetical protein